MSVPGEAPSRDGKRVLVHNPVSGDADHTDIVNSLAADRGFEVRETESAEDIVRTAAEAAVEADVVAAAGGDGTLTRAVRGLDEADAFDDTLFGVIPAGTGNNFAGNVGVTGIEHGFDVIDSGECRRIDVGMVDGTPFLNSVVAGLTAEASAETDPDEKARWGVFAYVMTTVRTAREFDGIHLTVEPADADTWECDAEIVLIGNARQFPREGRSQANVEDGMLDVTVIEEASTFDMVEESVQHLFGREVADVDHFTTPSVHIELDGTSERISVDGEMITDSDLTVGVRQQRLWIAVGDSYEPSPAT